MKDMPKKFVPMCIWRVATKLEMLGDEVLSGALKEAYATLTKTDANGHALCGCEGKVTMNATTDDNGKVVSYWVSCRGCLIETNGYNTEAEAWSAWDTALGLEQI